jgi:hypothetical protein
MKNLHDTMVEYSIALIALFATAHETNITPQSAKAMIDTARSSYLVSTASLNAASDYVGMWQIFATAIDVNNNSVPDSSEIVLIKTDTLKAIHAVSIPEKATLNFLPDGTGYINSTNITGNKFIWKNNSKYEDRVKKILLTLLDEHEKPSSSLLDTSEFSLINGNLVFKQIIEQSAQSNTSSDAVVKMEINPRLGFALYKKE